VHEAPRLGQRTNARARLRRAGIGECCENIVAMRTGLAAVLVALLAAGCGGNASTSSAPPVTTTNTVTETVTDTTPTTTAPASQTSLRLYFVAPDGRLVATARDVPQTQTPGAASLHELLTTTASRTRPESCWRSTSSLRRRATASAGRSTSRSRSTSRPRRTER